MNIVRVLPWDAIEESFRIDTDALELKLRADKFCGAHSPSSWSEASSVSAVPARVFPMWHSRHALMATSRHSPFGLLMMPWSLTIAYDRAV